MDRREPRSGSPTGPRNEVCGSFLCCRQQSLWAAGSVPQGLPQSALAPGGQTHILPCPLELSFVTCENTETCPLSEDAYNLINTQL